MILSLNEVEALAKKASRGAGYAWGVAEEAGKAARWLCARDVDGCAALAALLIMQDGMPYADTAPIPGDVWVGKQGRICPIAAGCALSDHAAVLPGAAHVEAVIQPVLLVPFAAGIALHLKTHVVLEWDDVCVSTDGAALSAHGDMRHSQATVSMRFDGDAASLVPQQAKLRAEPDPESYDILQRFAHRTYAPATEASRIAGAGAGLSDND